MSDSDPLARKYKAVKAEWKREGSARDTQVGGDHYKCSRYQPWDVLPDWLDGWPPFQAYLLGNIVKYIYRAPLKGDRLNDLRKARHYLDHLVELVEAELESSQDAAPPRHGDQFP